MSVVLDQTADTDRREFHRYSKLYPIPTYVKQAATGQVLDPQEELPVTAYADVAKRQFPCHTKAACYVSSMYFLEKRADMPSRTVSRIEQRLANFAAHWGIANDIRILTEKHAAIHKGGLGSLSDSAFALVWAGDNGRKDRHLPMRNTLEVKAAAEWFKQYRDHFQWVDRQTIATKILDKAAQFGAMLGEQTDEMLEKQAGRGIYNPQEVAEMLRNRVRAVSVASPIKERMLKLAELVEVNPRLAMDPATSANLCKTVDVFDRQTKLAGKYSPLVPRPEDVIFKNTLGTLGTFVKDACALTTGAIFDRQQFAKLALGEVRALLGDEIADAVRAGLDVDPEKMAEVAATLPRPDARKLEILLSDVGETPVIKQGTHQGFNWQEHRDLATVQDFLGDLQ